MMFALIIVGVCIILAATGQIFMKKGVTQLGDDGISSNLNFPGIFRIFLQKNIFVGLSIYMGGMILWLYALSKLDVSLAYPLVSLGYIITAILALVFLKENISTMRWAGIALIVIGSFLITRTV